MIHVAGVDEVGTGALAGPIVSAAVVFDEIPSYRADLRDSKELSASERERIAWLIFQDPNARWGVGIAPRDAIVSYGHQGSHMWTMREALRQVCPWNEAIADGTRLPTVPDKLKKIPSAWSITTLVKADRKVPSVSAASIVAKVVRDAIMVELDKEHPGYGFAKHKGYGTREHLATLAQLGPSLEHRQCRPVLNVVNQSPWLIKRAWSRSLVKARLTRLDPWP